MNDGVNFASVSADFHPVRAINDVRVFNAYKLATNEFDDRLEVLDKFTELIDGQFRPEDDVAETIIFVCEAIILGIPVGIIKEPPKQSWGAVHGY